MNVLLLANEEQKDELLFFPADNAIQLKWISRPEDSMTIAPVDACVDLSFENSTARISWLISLACPLIVVNSVVETSLYAEYGFIRINGWNTFLKRKVVEASCPDTHVRKKADELFAGFGRKIEWVPDIPGFVTPRLIASIINEAFFALQENVSTREDIDTAMKLGTNYPYGPFEWAERIGLMRIYGLLDALCRQHGRYLPAPLLKQTALA
jgi:3-hydroxybutyryl-CoA dehydrogenase